MGFEGPCFVQIKTQLEGQKRDLKYSKVWEPVGQNLDLLWAPNSVPILEIVHKTNENH